MVENLTQEKYAEYKAAFEIFDINQNGKITWTELSELLYSLELILSEEDLKEMINEFDENGDGQLGFEEFILLITSKINDSETEEELIEAFKTFDKDNIGYCTIGEFVQILKSVEMNLTSKEIDTLVRDIDPEDNGKINYQDFVNFMNK